MAGSYGSIAQFGASTSGAATSKFELISGNLDIREDPLHDAHGLIGSRSHPSERVRRNTRRPGGTVVMQPNAVELDFWLARILGTAESADLFALNDALTVTMDIDVDKVTRVETFSSCSINRATFRSQQGGPLEMELDIEALTTTVASAGTFPSLTLNVASGPYMHSDAVFTLSGTAYKFRSWSLVVDNMLDTERFFNTETRISLQPKDRVITWTFDGPYGDNVNLYGLALGGIAITAVFTNTISTGLTLTFSSTKVQFPRSSAVLNTAEEIMLPLVGIARRDGSTLELVTTNDSTP